MRLPDEKEEQKGVLLVFTVLYVLVAFSVGVTALIYWGGFVEEARNR